MKSKRGKNFTCFDAVTKVNSPKTGKAGRKKCFTECDGASSSWATTSQTATETMDQIEGEDSMVENKAQNLRSSTRQKHGKKTMCEICNKIFTRPRDLTRHVQFVHQGRSLPCEFCDKVFKAKHTLKAHKEREHRQFILPSGNPVQVKFEKDSNFDSSSDEEQEEEDDDGVEYLATTENRQSPLKEVCEESTHVDPADRSRKTCKICQKSFSRAGDVKRHYKFVHQGVSIPCEFCDKVYKSNHALNAHKRRDHNMVIQSTGVQVQLQLDKESVTKTGHGEFEEYQGYNADYQYANNTGSDELGQDVFQNGISLPAGYNDKLSESTQQVLRYCSICHAVFSTDSLLTAHMKENHPDQYEKQIKCGKCDLIFATAKDLTNHNMTVHPKLVIPCSFCNIAFSSLKSLQEHKRVRHQVDSTSTVDPTNRSCASGGGNNEPPESSKESGYKRRKKLPSEKDKDNVKGVVVSLGKRGALRQEMSKDERASLFPSEITPKEHAILVKGNGITCTFCGKHVLTRHKWKEHKKFHRSSRFTKSQHANTNSLSCLFKCEQCGLVFIHISELKQHHKIHSGEKPYQCTQCPLQFMGRDHLHKHIRSGHPRPAHECLYCDKAFGKKSHLRRHEQIHSDKQPYPCAFCSAILKTESGLCKHVELLHPEQSYNDQTIHP